MKPIRGSTPNGTPKNLAPLYQTSIRDPVLRRQRKAPIVASRVAGHQSDVKNDFDLIYFGPTSDFGRLNGHVWYRMRGSSLSSRPDAWRVCMDACGRQIYLDAYMDDFGNLVATSQ